MEEEGEQCLDCAEAAAEAPHRPPAAPSPPAAPVPPVAPSPINCCPTVDVAGAEAIQRHRSGLFRLLGDLNGQLVYQNKYRQFLYWSDRCRTWQIGPNWRFDGHGVVCGACNHYRPTLWHCPSDYPRWHAWNQSGRHWAFGIASVSCFAQQALTQRWPRPPLPPPPHAPPLAFLPGSPSLHPPLAQPLLSTPLPPPAVPPSQLPSPLPRPPPPPPPQGRPSPPPRLPPLPRLPSAPVRPPPHRPPSTPAPASAPMSPPPASPPA